MFFKDVKKVKDILIVIFAKQNKYHRHGVLMHTLKVCYHVLKNRDFKFLVPALLHDIGKPFVAFQDESDKKIGTYSFTHHEEKSYQIVKNWLITDFSKCIIRYHYLIRDIKKSEEKGNLVRMKEKKEIFESLSKEMQEALNVFLKYDDLGK